MKNRLKVAFISTYPPRHCGIATFAKSLVDIIQKIDTEVEPQILAITDVKNKYKYEKKVIFEIDQENPDSYLKAAKLINKSDIDILSLQHEYGIFGGRNGEYILKFLEKIRRPVVTNLHSVLSKEHQSKHLYRVTKKIIERSDRVVVMTNNAKKLLLKDFNLSNNKVEIIHHGVPNVLLDSKSKTKEDLGFGSKKVFSTFGLINPGKGIELAIEAFSQINKQHKDFVYLIVGATHPSVKRKSGEDYRNYLKALVSEFNLKDKVIFINKFLTYFELVEYLKATDIYLSPQLDLKQAFSGTLSYAMGCGDIVISTPTHYAKEMLSGGRGIIVKPNPSSLARGILRVMGEKNKALKIQQSSYNFSRSMIWPKVGEQFYNLLKKTAEQSREWQSYLPDFELEPPLNFLHYLTDGFGIVQHSRCQRPNYRFGYSIDDQARALLVCTKYLLEFPDSPDGVKKLLKIYLNFMDKAVDERNTIHNFLSKEQEYLDEVGSDDSRARSFWALSFLAKAEINDLEIKNKARKILSKYKLGLGFSNYVKTKAYQLLGFYNLQEKHRVIELGDQLVSRYLEIEKNYKRWNWFEKELTYANAIVPFSLLKAYKFSGKEIYLNVALRSLSFLEKAYTHKRKIPSPVGQSGWYRPKKRKSFFDQQPLEISDMVLLYNQLYYLTKNSVYRKKAKEWMGWYFGNNIKGNLVYNLKNHGIFDALTPEGVNKNQGAEPIVTYLLAYLSFRSEI